MDGLSSERLHDATLQQQSAHSIDTMAAIWDSTTGHSLTFALKLKDSRLDLRP